jgi:hypothetical protein
MPQCTKFSWSTFYLIIGWFLFLFLVCQGNGQVQVAVEVPRHFYRYDPLERLRREIQKGFFSSAPPRSRRPRVVQQRNTQQERYATTFNASIVFSLLQFSCVFSSSSDIPTVSHLKIIFWRTRITRVPECGTTEMWTHNPSAVATSFSSYKGRADIIQSCVLDFWGQVDRGVFIQLPR